MDNHFDQSASSNFYLTTTIFGSASFLGLVLALVGLYALVSYQVARRTREIGIRMALGAARGQVMRMVLREAAVMSIVGVGIGTPGAAQEACEFADGVVVGTSLVRPLLEGNRAATIELARQFRSAVQ